MLHRMHGKNVEPVATAAGKFMEMGKNPCLGVFNDTTRHEWVVKFYSDFMNNLGTVPDGKHWVHWVRVPFDDLKNPYNGFCHLESVGEK